MNYFFRGLEYLYIHWPFCPYKCHFCDFVAMASHEQFMKQYHDALCHEIVTTQPTLIDTKPIKTIYIGGGTPSTYPAELLLDMFAILREQFIFASDCEITLEVNPGTATEELIQVWHNIGINRLSIGVQSLKDKILQSLNRHQTVEQVANLLEDAQPYFENLSVDFILGLPGVSEDDWKAMINEAMFWPIKHISIYFLMVQENTPLYFKVASKKIVLPPDESVVDLYDWTVEFLKGYGFDRYELSNFAKPGYESKHNQVYWDRKAYRGFGLGACSFNGTIRFQNEKNLMQYINQAALPDKGLPIIMHETLSQEQIAIEKIMLGLRRSQGMSVIDYTEHLPLDKKETFFAAVTELESAGLVHYNQKTIQLTARGYALENEVAVRLFP